jgi:hypothetical protein
VSVEKPKMIRPLMVCSHPRLVEGGVAADLMNFWDQQNYKQVDRCI